MGRFVFGMQTRAKSYIGWMGFPVSSLAFLGRELLITDGMEEYVCVHDFGIVEDAADKGYDLEW